MREAASFIAGQSRSAQAGFVPQLVDGIGRMFRAWMHRRTVSRLIDMDDHLLADIGLAREEVRQALGQPFGVDPSVELQQIALRRRGRGWRA